MDKAEYDTLLDKGYADLPDVLYKKERFTLPEVRGKLIKSRTVITNFTDIAKHIERDSNHFSKFMLKELGVRGEIDHRGELVLHSRFQPSLLNKSVKKYFTGFVECTHCNSPDTILINDSSVIKCNACGHEGKVSKI
jgi:translation initiation factor 2 subunit 2